MPQADGRNTYWKCCTHTETREVIKTGKAYVYVNPWEALSRASGTLLVPVITRGPQKIRRYLGGYATNLSVAAPTEASEVLYTWCAAVAASVLPPSEEIAEVLASSRQLTPEYLLRKFFSIKGLQGKELKAMHLVRTSLKVAYAAQRTSPSYAGKAAMTPARDFTVMCKKIVPTCLGVRSLAWTPGACAETIRQARKDRDKEVRDGWKRSSPARVRLMLRPPLGGMDTPKRSEPYLDPLEALNRLVIKEAT